MTARKLIVLVSHDALARAMLRKVLESDGCFVGEAANAKEGERTLRRVNPAVTIADLQMEVVEGGVGVIESLHAADGRSLLYLMTTGDASTLAFGWQQLGLTGIFLKPIDPAIVSQTLGAALR